MGKKNIRMEETQYTYDDLFQAVSCLDDEKKTFLMQTADMRHVLSMMNSDKTFEKTMKSIDTYIAYYQLLQVYLVDLKECLESGSYIVAAGINVDTISENYDSLEEDEKKAVVLNLLNNADFQKKCCEILAVDFKRVVNSDATLKAIDNLTGLSRYFDRMVRLGIGCNHKYEVES